MNTMHSIIRANERAGMKPKEAIRFTNLAIRNGQRADDLPCLERRYLESKETEPTFTAVLYKGYIFILKDEVVCVTMYLAPSWFFSKQYFDGKKRVRNVKKYCRYYDSYGMGAA